MTTSDSLAQPTPQIPGMMAAMPAGPPSVDPTNQLGVMLTNMYSVVLQLNTQSAVMQASMGNMDRRMATIEHGFDARLRELEQARIQELTTMGSMRTEVVERTGNAANKAVSGDLSMMQQIQNRNMQLQTLLIGAGCSFVTAILVIVLTSLVHR